MRPDTTPATDAESAQALEQQARAGLAGGDLCGAAALLERAAQAWQSLNSPERAGTCWLLAASTWRLAGALEASERAARCANALEVSGALRRGIDMERAEQALASGQAALASERFSALLAQHGAPLDDRLRAVVLQRRAAASLAAHDPGAAASDFMQAAALMPSLGLAADSEAARLAAVSCWAGVDAAAAEALWQDLDRLPPPDGTAAARRGLVGAQIALQGGHGSLALERLDRARQGALDARDALSYLAASVQAASVLEQEGQAQAAYTRLASAWVTLGDLLGKEAAARLVRPALAGLRERLGEAAFRRARAAHDAQRRHP